MHKTNTTLCALYKRKKLVMYFILRTGCIRQESIYSWIKNIHFTVLGNTLYSMKKERKKQLLGQQSLHRRRYSSPATTNKLPIYHYFHCAGMLFGSMIKMLLVVRGDYCVEETSIYNTTHIPRCTCSILTMVASCITHVNDAPRSSISQDPVFNVAHRRQSPIGYTRPQHKQL